MQCHCTVQRHGASSRLCGESHATQLVVANTPLPPLSLMLLVQKPKAAFPVFLVDFPVKLWQYCCKSVPSTHPHPCLPMPLQTPAAVPTYLSSSPRPPSKFSLSHLQKLKAAFPIFLSDFPIELRQYPRGAEMPWHLDEQMYASPQWELIYTLDNTSDSRCAAATAAAFCGRSGVKHAVCACPRHHQLVLQPRSQPVSQQASKQGSKHASHPPLTLACCCRLLLCATGLSGGTREGSTMAAGRNQTPCWL